MGGPGEPDEGAEIVTPPDIRGHQIHEDIGGLKALVSSMDAKMDAAAEEFRNLREDHTRMRLEITEIKGQGLSRSEAISRIEKTSENVEQRVDELFALRNRLGGAFFLFTLVSGSIWAGWGYIERFITQIGK